MPRLLGWSALVLVVAVLVGGLSQAVVGTLSGAGEPSTPHSRFGDIEGDVAAFLGLAVLGWVIGGFAEEMIFRGFLLDRSERLARALGVGGRAATALAVVVQATLFGAVHAYDRGVLGAVPLAGVGVVLGVFYVRLGRSLWPTILAHGTIDTLGFLEDFLGA